jgi:hypothetical protein
VVKPITIRTVLSIVVSAGWEIQQVDVSNTFIGLDLLSVSDKSKVLELDQDSYSIDKL